MTLARRGPIPLAIDKGMQGYGLPNQTGGVADLVEQKRWPRNPHPNRVAADVEKRILDYSLQFPTHRPQRVANQFRLENVNISAGGVRGVWLRPRHRDSLQASNVAREARPGAEDHAHGPAGPPSRAAQRRFPLPARRALASRRAAQSGHILLGHAQRRRQGLCPGLRRRLLLRDFAKVYTSKMPITAADLLHDRFLLFYEKLGVTVGATRAASLQAAACHGRQQASDYEGPLAPHQRLRRADEPNAAGRSLPHSGPPERSGTPSPARFRPTSTPSSTSTTSSAPTRAIESLGGPASKRSPMLFTRRDFYRLCRPRTERCRYPADLPSAREPGVG